MSAATQYQSYYTKSEPILNYMATMLDIKSTDLIFEPCAGDGVFVDKILEQIPSANISIFELNPEAVLSLQRKYDSIQNVRIKLTDTLLDDAVVRKLVAFDKIIGNPPYGARNSSEKKEELNKLYPELYTKESYTLFLFACVRCLKERGLLSFIIPDTFLSLHRHISIRQYILKNTKIKELSMIPSSYFPGINFGYANLCIITLQKDSDVASNLSHRFCIRNGFSAVEELEYVGSGHCKEYSQADIYNNIDSAFFFNSSERVNDLINDISIHRIGDIANCVTGFYSGNDKAYLRPVSMEMKNAKKYQIVSKPEICDRELSEEEKKYGIRSISHFVPIVKGGNKKYIKPNDWFMDWSEAAIIEYKKSKKCRFQNSSFYFKKNGIAIPMIRSGRLTAALIEGRLFDQSIVGIFPHQEQFVYYLLAFFNSSICTKLISAINPSTNNSANYIKKIPFIYPSQALLKEVNTLTKKMIDCILNGEEDVVCYESKLEVLFEELYKM